MTVVETEQVKGCEAVIVGLCGEIPMEVVDWAEAQGATEDRPDRYILVETEELSGELQGVVAQTTMMLPASFAAAIRAQAADEAENR